jgi:hypothetical protein
MTESNCFSLEPHALKERVAAWRSLGGALIGGEPTLTGAALRYRLDAGVPEVLLDLLEAERQCCPSRSFEATVDLNIDAPKETRRWVRDTFRGTPDLSRRQQRPTPPRSRRRWGGTTQQPPATSRAAAMAYRADVRTT